jgi:hypothetical protein
MWQGLNDEQNQAWTLEQFRLLTTIIFIKEKVHSVVKARNWDLLLGGFSCLFFFFLMMMTLGLNSGHQVYYTGTLPLEAHLQLFCCSYFSG